MRGQTGGRCRPLSRPDVPLLAESRAGLFRRFVWEPGSGSPFDCLDRDARNGNANDGEDMSARSNDRLARSNSHPGWRASPPRPDCIDQRGVSQFLAHDVEHEHIRHLVAKNPARSDPEAPAHLFDDPRIRVGLVEGAGIGHREELAEEGIA